MATLTCPKCGSDMRSYERNRILVDQCIGCGGLFLDRGELESLVAAENAWHSASSGRTSGAPVVASPQDRPRDDRPRDDRPRDDRRGSTDEGYTSRGHDDRYDNRGYDPRYRKKKKSFLAELFDD